MNDHFHRPSEQAIACQQSGLQGVKNPCIKRLIYSFISLEYYHQT